MPGIGNIGGPLIKALDKIQDFMKKTTGRDTSQDEIARALGRYFVLKEIKDHIEMERRTEEGAS